MMQQWNIVTVGKQRINISHVIEVKPWGDELILKMAVVEPESYDEKIIGGSPLEIRIPATHTAIFLRYWDSISVHLD